MARLRILAMGAILALALTNAAGQSSSTVAWGYFFGAPGGAFNGDSEAFLHLGGGGEGLLSGGLGWGLELGVLGQFEDFADTAIGAFSPGMVYAFNGDRKVVPFVAGGYTLFFRSATANGAFVGGGVNYWIGKHFGLRFEVRDNIWLEGSTANLVEGRVGVLIR